ncbi:MAG TPA: RluA family pseudouridine synthase [Candidatus Saccharicenans sp.]|nr:RluA family pseudouridine synthase [Candidatus Saccharicenans sp.]HQO75945.1 RluA family pseudouridine synthase [Candidatus Saccharicenans sp.]
MIRSRFQVAPGEIKRLDLFLREKIPQLSRSRIQKAIKDGQVKVNGLIARPGQKLKPQEVVEISVEEKAAPSDLEAQPIELEVIYEDEQILVINKPFGLVVHPGAGLTGGTLANGLIFYYPEIKEVGSPLRPGIVHRLDKDTSGLIVVARTQAAYNSLRQQFEDRTVEKIYLGLARGRFKEKEGIIDLPVGRHPALRQKMSVKSKKPRLALTRYEVLREFRHSTFLALKPLTGRTHQLRVHLAAIGHPLVGDSRYGQTQGNRRQQERRLFLHAFRLSFRHPLSGEKVEFESPLPPALEARLEREAKEK